MFHYMKIIVKLFFFAVSALILLSLAVVIQDVDPQQQKPDIETFTFADTLAHRKYDLDSLKALIGENKGLPAGFEIAAAIAYTAYPQLKDVKIDMVFTKGGAPMMASLDIWSLFGPRSQRRYKILLNDAKNTFFDPILLRNLPFDAQVGILAHELGHVAYYHQLNLLEFGNWGLSYLRSDEYHAAHERSTDLMPVYHGLGSQIYQYAFYVRHDPRGGILYESAKDFIDKYYMTDKELLKVINGN